LKHRGTFIETYPTAFLESFYKHPIKQDKWNAFLRDISHEIVPFERVVNDLRKFFAGVFEQRGL
jgi:hypothetical protein